MPLVFASVLELGDNSDRTPLSVAAERGDVHAVEGLLSEGAKIQATDNAGRTPLLWAAIAGQKKTLELLIAEGADCRAEDHAGRSPLSYSAEYDHHDACRVIVSALSSSMDEEQMKSASNPTGVFLDHDDDDEDEDSDSDDDFSVGSADSMILPLSHAVNSADEATVQIMLHYGLSSYYKSAWEEEPSAIITAAKRGNPLILKLVIEAKIPHRTDIDGRGALIHAAARGHDSVIRVLLAHPDVDLHEEDEYGRTALFYARRYGHESTVRLLLSTGCEQGRPHETSSARASKKQRTDDDSDDSTSAAESAASATRGIATLDRTLDAPDTLTHELNTQALFRAFEDGDGDRIQEVLRASPDLINAKNDDGQSPLTLAVLLGNKAIIRYVLSCEKLNPNTQDHTGCTALSLAIKRKSLAVCNVLARRRDINPMLQDNEGMTALSLSLYHGLHSVTRTLVNESLAHFKDDRRRSIFHHAVLASADDILHVLLEIGSPADCPDEQGRTPLSYAAEKGTEFGVRFLLEKGNAMINSVDQFRRTPLSYATECGEDDIIATLVQAPNIDLTLACTRGRTPLSYACIHTSAPSRDILLSLAGSCVNVPDENGRTPLSWAAYHGSMQNCSLLLDLDADINRSDVNSRNSLSYAAEAAQADIVRLFLQTKQKISVAPDTSGRSPLDWAASSIQNLESEPYLNWHTFMVRKWNVLWLMITGNTTSRPEATSFDELLRFAIERGDQLAVSQLTRSSLKNAIECPERLIEHAMCHGSDEMVGTVLESLSASGFHPFNFPVLSFAASEGRKNLVKIMLSDGVEHKEAGSYLPFGHAVSQGHVETMRAFLRHDASHANTADKAGRTPLIIASTNGQTDALTCLLQADEINVNGTDKAGRSALSHAVDARCVRLVRLLLADSRVHTLSRDKDGRSPLFYAAARWSHTGVQLLYEKSHYLDTTRVMQ